MRFLDSLVSFYDSSSCRLYTSVTTHSKQQAALLSLAVGALVLGSGLTELATAQPGLGVDQGDERIEIVTTRIFSLIEGNAGALIMVIAGLAAIISAAFGAYRASVSLLVVAVGAFILRALVDIFFNFEENPQ